MQTTGCLFILLKLGLAMGLKVSRSVRPKTKDIMCTTEKTITLPFKVTDDQRTRRIGVAVSSLHDLKRKSNKVFCLCSSDAECDSLCVTLEDGTEVCEDSYLLSLQKHTLLIVSCSKPLPIKQVSLSEAMERYLTAVEDLRRFQTEDIFKFLDDNSHNKLKLTWQYVASLSKSKSQFSSRTEHPEWFTGCNKLVTFKEEYFRKCAQGRIRSYLRDAKSRLEKGGNSVASTKILERFKNRLEAHQYFADYFDRMSKDVAQRLCDVTGRFDCQGKYNEPTCCDSHYINPYDNAESRILFSTWNLDHVVERVTILAHLVQSINSTRNGFESKTDRYFDLLFTRSNLKLVHKTCHVIAPHVECSVNF